MMHPEKARLLLSVILSCLAQAKIRLGVASRTVIVLLIATQLEIVAFICSMEASGALTVPNMPPVDPPPST